MCGLPIGAWNEENCFSLLLSGILIFLFPRALSLPQSWSSSFNTLGAVGERWVSLAAFSQLEKLGAHAPLSLFPPQGGIFNLLFHYVVAPRAMLVQFLLPL